MNDEILWFAARGAGIVSLLLLTAVVGLGVLTAVRFQRPAWPRFLTAGLHRNLALLAVAFLGVHIATTVLDPFASLGLAAAAIPFASSYRPLWVGLGVIALDLFLALVLSSLLRARLGVRAWRAIHWLAYACWPLALLHGVGAGSDATAPWMLALDVACVALVVGAGAWRLAGLRSPHAELIEVVHQRAIVETGRGA